LTHTDSGKRGQNSIQNGKILANCLEAQYCKNLATIAGRRRILA